MPKSDDLLSPHFTIKEFTRSATAEARGLWNWPGAAQLANLERLALEFERVRALCGGIPFIHRLDTEAQKKLTKLGKAFGIITNAYRDPQVNAAVGGHPSSAHMDGRAIDFLPPKGWTLDQMQKAIESDDSILFDKIIEERTADKKSAWLHFQIEDEGATPKRSSSDLIVDADGVARRAEG